MTTQIKAGVIAANAITASELASSALSGGSFTGDVTFDTTTLVVDSSNNRVGIGQSSPAELLHVYGTDPVIRVSDDGTTGFPSLQLLQGNVTTEGTELLYDSSTGHTHLNTIYTPGGDIRFGTATGSLGSTGNVRMTIDHTGNVGIGTTDPSYALHIVNSSGIAEMEIDGSQAAELNLKDGNSPENERRGRLSLDSGRFRFEGLNDADDTVTHKGFTLNLDDGQMYLGDYTILYGGGAAESGLTINVRNPSDVDRGTVAILDNETAYNSTPQASISFGGKYNTSGDQTFFSRIVGYKANTTSGNATSAMGFNLRNGTNSLHTALDLITGNGGAGGVLKFPDTNIFVPNPSNAVDGARIIYYNSDSDAYYATGISSNTLWNISDNVHQWYVTVSGSAVQTLRLTPEGLTLPTAASDGVGTASNSSLQAGQIYWNTTNENFKFYDGSVWRNFNSPSISSISGLDLWADVTAGISSTSISDLSGNSRTGTASSTTSKGTLNGNTYFNFDDANYVQYGIGSIPNYVGGDVSYFFVCTNRRTQASYGSYLTQQSGTDGYQILRHASTSLNYNFYFKDAGNIDCNPSNATVPVNATINEAYIIIFSFDSSGGVTIYIRENGTELSDAFTSKFTGTNYSHSWTGNGGYTRVGNSAWATEELNAGMFAWGIIDHALNGDERQIIYDYYGAKGLAN